MRTDLLPKNSDSWCNPITGFLSKERFETLAAQYPSFDEIFPHIVEHETWKPLTNTPGYICSSRYRVEDSPDLRAALTPSWRQFLAQIEDPEGEYLPKITEMFATPFEVRFTWHLGYEGFYLTPHRDAKRKLATHLFYFNRAAEWEPEWGGNLCKLSGKVEGSDPDNPTFADFQNCEELPLLDNQSVFLYRTEGSWHGVKPMHCGSGKFRLAFNVIFERINYG